MELRLRRGTPADSAECGRICFEAFKSIADQHNFPQDFPSPDVPSGLMAFLFGHPNFYSTVAELDGRIVGSNFLDERSQIAGVGPISVDPKAQSRGIGRRLMEDVLTRSRERGFAGVRLVQAGYNNQTLCLYTKLGFRTREPLSLMTGSPPRVKLTGYNVRSAGKEDVDSCNRLCRTVHGHDRAGEIEDAVREKTATVVERLGRVTGYATSVGFFAHAVSETNEDMMALIGAAESITGPGILVPTRNHALFVWCLKNGLQLNQQMTHMSTGLYCEPAGIYLPSVLY
ncbi:MAG TPA: GNAT family N-acetyltransferase [Xanthobacteraceae bacterium]|jgi:GNAT superfamily N-acetyltransferase